MNIETLDFMAHFVPNSIPRRPPLGLPAINLIGERTRTGWADYETERQAGGYTFTFDGLHIMPEVASEMADQIIDLLELR
jgi:hypothetical protein